jgi:hypothetical protein
LSKNVLPDQVSVRYQPEVLEGVALEVVLDVVVVEELDEAAAVVMTLLVELEEEEEEEEEEDEDDEVVVELGVGLALLP